MLHLWLRVAQLCFFIVHFTGLATAQTLSLSEYGTGITSVQAEVGDEVEIAVDANLGRFSATGVSLYIIVPEGPFRVIDSGLDGQAGIQPFSRGPLFEDAMEVHNMLLDGSKIPGVRGKQLLEYSIVQGPGQGRGRQGRGIIAMFSVRVEAPITDGEIAIYSSPILETRLLLEDGRGEQSFAVKGSVGISGVEHSIVEQASSWGRLKALFFD